MVKSVAASTLKQYESSFKCWWEFAYSRKMDVFNAKTSDIIIFLIDCLNKGANYSALSTSRSAIALISAYDIDGDGLISRFSKGVFKERPTKPRYASTWDINPVLNYLEKLGSIKKLKMMEAVEKVVTILALATAQGLQTLSVIKVDNIERSSSEIKIKITDQIKTSKIGACQPELILLFFKDKPNLCTAKTILDYSEITKEIRDSNTKNLFIATKKPYGPVTAQTIGHWIKKVLKKAGVDTDQFTADSTRHAATSTAHKRGKDIEVIRRSAGWSPNSNTFLKFYNKPIQTPSGNFARAILEK